MYAATTTPPADVVVCGGSCVDQEFGTVEAGKDAGQPEEEDDGTEFKSSQKVKVIIQMALFFDVSVAMALQTAVDVAKVVMMEPGLR